MLDLIAYVMVFVFSFGFSGLALTAVVKDIATLLCLSCIIPPLMGSFSVLLYKKLTEGG